MPTISMFYGIIVRMFNFDNRRHSTPHIHVEYQGDEAVFNIETGEVIEGKFDKRKTKLVQAWIEIHKDDLFADWNLAINGEPIFKIKPLD